MLIILSECPVTSIIQRNTKTKKKKNGQSVYSLMSIVIKCGFKFISNCLDSFLMDSNLKSFWCVVRSFKLITFNKFSLTLYGAFFFWARYWFAYIVCLFPWVDAREMAKMPFFKRYCRHSTIEDRNRTWRVFRAAINIIFMAIGITFFFRVAFKLNILIWH